MCRAASGIALRDDIVIVRVQPVEHPLEAVSLDLVETELIIPIGIDALERTCLLRRLAGGEE